MRRKHGFASLSVLLFACVIGAIFFSIGVHLFSMQNSFESNMKTKADLLDLRIYIQQAFDCVQTTKALPAGPCTNGQVIALKRKDGSTLVEIAAPPTYTRQTPSYPLRASCVACSEAGCLNGKKVLVQTQRTVPNGPPNATAWRDVFNNIPLPCSLP